MRAEAADGFDKFCQGEHPLTSVAEGKIYSCNWVSEHGGFRLWLDRHPEIAGVDRSFDRAYRRLWSQICEKYGDGEAQLEFVTELPDSGLLSKFGGQAIVKIVGNASAEGPLNFAQCYTGGVCHFCGHPLGERNTTTGTYSAIPPGAGSFTAAAFLHLFSEPFIGLLRPDERSGLRFLPVAPARKSPPRKYFELVGDPIAGYVGVRNLERLIGSQCPECDGRRYGYYVRDFPIHEFVARADLPKPLPSCFAIGDTRAGLLLCMTAQRWRELAKRPERKGLIAEPIGIVEDRDLERTPKLPLKKTPVKTA